MRKLFQLFVFSFLSLASINSIAEDTSNPEVRMQTSLGAITIELYPDKAPETVKNFLEYVEQKFFAGTIFHRVVPGFVVQGGGFTYDFRPKKTLDPIVNEANNGLKNTIATLSMARTGDPNSATSQFFINLKDNETLDYKKDESDGYAVFAKVIEGMEVVKKIAKEPRGLYRAHPDAPNYPVIIEDVIRLK